MIETWIISIPFSFYFLQFLLGEFVIGKRILWQRQNVFRRSNRLVSGKKKKKKKYHSARKLVGMLRLWLLPPPKNDVWFILHARYNWNIHFIMFIVCLTAAYRLSLVEAVRCRFLCYYQLCTYSARTALKQKHFIECLCIVFCFCFCFCFCFVCLHYM